MKYSPAGTSILRAIANEGLKIFSIEQAKKIAKDLKIRPNYVPEIFHYLQKTGWISRLKKGVYFFNAQSGFGSPPHDFEIAIALVNPCAISHWTAMHYHHLTDQTPNKIYAITPTGTAIPRFKKDHFIFIQIKKEYYFGIEKIWINETVIQITDPERTLLDGLMNPQNCGDFQEVLHAFKMLGDKMNLEKIIHYALKLDAATSKRLGWILEKSGYASSLTKGLMKLPIKGYRRLDPTGPSKGPYNKKWMIQENV